MKIWKEKSMSSTERVLEKLVKRAPFILSLEGVMFQLADPNLNATAVGLLSKFENLEAIRFSNRYNILNRYGYVEPAIRAGDLITFIESTRSRTKLKEISVEDHFVDDNFGELLDAFNLRVADQDQQRIQLKKLIINHEDTPDWRSTNGWQAIFTLIDGSMLTSLSLGESPIDPQLLSTLLQSAPNLHHLGFAFMCCPTKDCDGHRVDAYKDLMDTLAGHPNVDELQFFDCPRGFNVGGNCWQFKAEFMQMLASIGHRLRALKINLDTIFDGIIDGDQIATIIFNYMPRLQSIHLIVGQKISTETIKEIVGLENLEEISLKAHEGMRISDEIIATIGQSTRLKSLRLYGDDREIGLSSTFLGLATLTTLTKLEIKREKRIPNGVFVPWSNAFGSSLEELNLFFAVGFEEQEGLVDMIKTANRLRVLDLANLANSNFTDEILDAIATSCPNLEDVGKLYRISENNIGAVQKIIDACPKLKIIHSTKFGSDQELRAQLKIDKYRNLRIY